MKKTALLLALVVLLTPSVRLLADGKFYWPEPIPPEIPYQRAVLMFDQGQETLLLQSKYRLASSASDDFGWIVPVPSVPELASMAPSSADQLFFRLGMQSKSTITDVSDMLLAGILLLLPLGALLTLLACLLSFFVPGMRFVRRRRALLAVSAGVVLVGSFLFVCFGLFLLTGRQAEPVEGVEIIKAEQVGVYDVQVVRSDRSGDLIQWLNQNRFEFDETDRQVFDEYLRQDWSFVVARIDRRAAKDRGDVVSEGLVAPLILRFRTETPVYPLALTSTSGHDTQILLYVLAQGQWDSDGRLESQYAGAAAAHTTEALRAEVEPTGFFSDAELALPFLCKFKGTLTPEQMREDLRFARVGDDQPYRKHIVKW